MPRLSGDEHAMVTRCGLPRTFSGVSPRVKVFAAPIGRERAPSEAENSGCMLGVMNAPITSPESSVGESSSAEDAYRFDQLSDAELLTNTRRLVGRSNQLLADLLAHLAEVEARGIHRLRACPSLYAYCLYELRLSEDAAFRRDRQ